MEDGGLTAIAQPLILPRAKLSKVAFEIAIMAADAGVVRTDEDVVSIGGTGRGADTAIVLAPVHTHNFFDIKVKEILCKPHF